jgi:hypothetical protein
MVRDLSRPYSKHLLEKAGVKLSFRAGALEIYMPIEKISAPVGCYARRLLTEMRLTDETELVIHQMRVESELPKDAYM